MSQQGKAAKNDEGDYLFDALSECWEHVVVAYQQCEDERPIMLYDIQEKQIYAYQYEGFKNDMSERSQALLAEQYELALASGQMIVFVRDNDNERLVSYSLDYK
jgi:hypothetical protein